MTPGMGARVAWLTCALTGALAACLGLPAAAAPAATAGPAAAPPTALPTVPPAASTTSADTAPAPAPVQPRLPVTAAQRQAAQRVAQAGVALAELAPDAPASHTVRSGDTLWGLAGLFLRTPWRWPELWGMNLEQVRNPHLIYPGQVLVLERADGRARLRLAGRGAGLGGQDGGAGAVPTVRLSPQARPSAVAELPIAAVSRRALQPFLSESMVFGAGELDAAPRIVGSQDGRLLMSVGETAYVRGDLDAGRDFHIFRAPVPVRDPLTREVLGYEARFVGRGSAQRAEQTAAGADGRVAVVPAALRLTQTRVEATVGDRLAPASTQDWAAFVPRAPGSAVEARVAAIVDEGLSASQKQLVALNQGAREGVERGHVLALWRTGTSLADPADPAGRKAVPLQLPDERHGLLMVVRVFDRVSYALVLDTRHPVRVGDRVTQP